MDTTSTTVKKKTASALLKEFGLDVQQAETLFNQIFDALEKDAGDDDEDEGNNNVDDGKAE
jgi:hypothetical protein